MISAYKDISNLLEFLPKLKFDGKFEIIIAADCISLSDKKKLEKLGAKVNYSKIRRGKVTAMNVAEEKAKGELLVFIDSDTTPTSKNFLNTIWKNYKRKDFDVAIGKVSVKENRPLQKLINIDYLFINTFFIISKFFKEVPPLLGAFFVIKRKAFEDLGKFSRVIVEDVDLGLKASAAKMKFHLMKDVSVKTAAPHNFKAWFTQRRRWVIGGVKSLSTQKKKMVRKFPWTYSSLLAYYPLPISSLSWFLFFSLFVTKITVFGVIAASLVSTGFMMFFFSKILKWNLKLKPALYYLLFYGPIWSIVSIYLILSAPFFKNDLEDWVV